MTPDQIKNAYRLALSQFEVVLFRRYTGTGALRTATDYPVRARVLGYQPDELTGGIVQGERRVIALAEDILNTGFVLPLTETADKIVIRGRELAVKAVDDNTRRVGGELIAFDIRCGG
jgi:hypothetical protein